MQPVIDTLTKFAQDLLVLALPIVAAFVVQWLRAKAKEIAGRTHLNHLYEMQDMAAQAVRAAEQYLGAGSGADKKTQALHTVQKYLEDRGVRLDVAVIDAAVEAAVWREFGAGGLRPAQAAGGDGLRPAQAARQSQAAWLDEAEIKPQ